MLYKKYWKLYDEYNLRMKKEFKRDIPPKFVILCAPTYGNLGDQALLKGEQRFIEKYFPDYKSILIQFIQVLLEANGLAAGKDHQFKGRYDAEKNAVIISLEKDEQSALSPQKCTT